MMLDKRRAGSGVLDVLAVSGSLRRDSYNTALLRAASEQAASLIEIELFGLGGIPLYDEDLRLEGSPARVEVLKERIRRADGVLFASPEYNYSFSGVLKNAIDWVSRPSAECPLGGKPCAMIGASSGRSGTMRSQAALRQVLSSLNAFVLPRPELFITGSRQKFSAEGKLIDSRVREQLGDLLAVFANWMSRVSVPATPESRRE